MPSWGYGGPHDSGCYKQWPQETGFFHENGNWRTPYGQFFLQVCGAEQPVTVWTEKSLSSGRWLLSGAWS